MWVRLTLSHRNDNIFLGAFSSLGLRDGNDLGDTSSFLLKYEVLKSRSQYAVEFFGGLYTTQVAGTETHWQQEPNANRVPLWSTQTDFAHTNNPGEHKQQDIRILDINRLMLSWKDGKPFSIRGAVGLELRGRNPNDLPFSGAKIQTSSHNLIKAYPFDYIGTGHQEQRDRARVDANGVTTNEIIRPEIAAEELKTPVSKESVIVSGGVGATTSFFDGRCELEADLDATISTEKQQLIGPNSNIALKGQMTTTLGSKRPDRASLRALTGAAVYFYPTSGEISQRRVGENLNAGLQGVFPTNHAIYQPYITIDVPLNRRVFEHFNQDQNGMLTLGTSILFKLPSSKK